MLNQPSNMSPDEINGSGTVDLTQGLTISWQVSGDSPLYAYRIVFYQNNAASTQVMATAKTTLVTPFWGVNYKGETQFFSATISAVLFASAGMTNGNEYKYLITQWYGPGASDYITQTTASLIECRAAPTLAIDSIPNPLTSRSCSITATYSQAQGDAVQYVRWQIATQDAQSEPFLDTGRIRGTGELRVDYDGFFTGTTYSVVCTVETVMGVTVSTGWVDFAVSYEVGEPQGQVQACQLSDDSAVFVHWDQMAVAEGYSVYRRDSQESVLRKIADVDATTGQLRDYSTRSGHIYTYYIFPIGALAYLTEPMVSDEVSVQFWMWSILEASADANGVYHLIRDYLFRMGEGGVKEGQFANNNAPQLLKNFTRYPTRQPETSNYLSGNVSGYIGSIDWSRGGYVDTVRQSERIFNLSTTTNALFLLDPKGHFLRIHTSDAISLTIRNRTRTMPQTMTVGWAEVGSTDGVSLVAAQGGQYYPTDTVAGTTLRVDPESGTLLWTIPASYRNGSQLILDQESGTLIQDASGSFTPAEMTFTQETGMVTATIAEGGDD